MLLSIWTLLVGIVFYEILNKSLIAEPVNLIGEGEYNLNALKEIKVTDSYLGMRMDQDIKDCQNKEPFFNCTTRKYINTFLGE